MSVELGPKFKKALEFATDVHTGQLRKGTSIPNAVALTNRHADKMA
jgi:hypothetical protein